MVTLPANYQSLLRNGRLDEAAAACTELLARNPRHVDALRTLGTIRLRQQLFPEALAFIQRALEAAPASAELLVDYGRTLAAAGDPRNAIAAYDEALTMKLTADALVARGAALSALGRSSDALASFDQAIALDPADLEALVQRAGPLFQLKRYAEGIESCNHALALNPKLPKAYYNRGVIYEALGKDADAAVSYQQTLDLAPSYAAAAYNRGNALARLHRYLDALASYDQALTSKPHYPQALVNRGNVLKELQRYPEALASYENAIGLDPSSIEAHYCRGNLLARLFKFEDALRSYEHALKLAPDHPYALGELASAKLAICEWSETERLSHELTARIADRKSIFSPFIYMGYSSDPALHLQCAQNFVRHLIPALPQPLWRGEVWRNTRVKLAYLSADFYRHATSYLMAQLFEIHDRSRFEVIGVSYGPDDKSEMRARIAGGFDEFLDVRAMTDYEIASMLHARKIDIALDLKGYTTDARIGILAHRPAPVQVNYLGYPGSMGASFIDYVIADNILVPFEGPQFNTERIVYLPDTFQVNDCSQVISPRVFKRTEFGLPEEGFVFCCFNNNYKITAEVFDIWMRLLRAVPSSALWLLEGHPVASQNLRREADARGVDPNRILFAKRMPRDEHLARHRLADLFLDTLPVNALTTASDALWAGLPVLTCLGSAAPGRGGASLLRAVGLPELIVGNLSDYEALARRLASDAALLKSLRRKLAANREVFPLFDTARYRQHLETAFLTMWEIWQSGERPASFCVRST